MGRVRTDARRAAAVAVVAFGIAVASPCSVFAHGGEVHVEPEVTHTDTPAELSDVSVTRALAAARLAGAVESDVFGFAGGLPTDAWCGTPTTVDDTTNSTYAASAPQFKVIYAYPADRPNRFAQWAGALQANASLITAFLAAQPSATRAPRFDLGTSCGQQYLDIQTVALPGTRASYAQNFGAVASAINQRVVAIAGQPRDYMVLADTMGAGISGTAALYAGSDRPDAANVHNNGGLTSVLWVPDTVTPPASPVNGWQPTIMLHEMSHNLGAVQNSAPHTSYNPGVGGTGGHCWDGYDVMCYRDSAAMPVPYTTTVCGSIGGVMWQTYDCNQDDYFNPSPAPGSYLDTHWNVNNSVFMGECTALGTCAEAPPAPVNTSPPTVSGTVQVGQDLAASPGGWSLDSTYTYIWQRCGLTCSAIAGATGQTYRVTTADIASKLRVVVRATTADGGAAQTPSAQTATVGQPPVGRVAPGLSGLAVVGRVLSSSTGTWYYTPTSYAYRWQRCTTDGQACADIAGATALTYTLTTTDVGARLRMMVTATSAAGSATATSPLSATVREAYLNTEAPTVTGTAKVGELLTATQGTWTPSAPASVAWQWLRCTTASCAAIAGATLPTYRVVQADWNFRLAIRVTPLPDSAPAATSAQTDAVVLPQLVNTAIPAITGLAQTASTLTSTSGTWNQPVKTLGMQWQRCEPSGGTCADITGQISPRYVAQLIDVDKDVRTRLVATLIDGQTMTVYSARVAVHAAPFPAATVQPAVAGANLRRYDVLTAQRGTWTTAWTYALQWRRCSGGTCTDIAGAIAPTYRLTKDDEGSDITVAVTATGPGGSTTVQAPIRGPVLAFAPTSVTAPGLVLARAQQGVRITTTRGVWATSADTTYTYTWERCETTEASSCVALPGQTGTIYVPVLDDVDKRLRAVVRAANVDGAATAATPISAAVLPLAPRLSVLPGIAGTPRVDQTLSLTQGTWLGDVSALADVWMRCARSCITLPATATTYRVLTADVGFYLKVRETATGPGGATIAYSGYLGPVSSPLAGTASLTTAGGTADLRTAGGETLGTAGFSAGAAAAAAASKARPMRVRVKPRRALRIVACGPATGDEPWKACSQPRTIRRATTITVPGSRGRVRITAMPVKVMAKGR